TRHAETVQNLNNQLTGRFSVTTDRGKEQIRKLIKRLEKEKIDVVFSSDLPRCVEIVKAINNAYGTPFILSQKLREKSQGKFEGKDVRNINWDSLPGDFETKKLPGGESLKEVRDRIKSFIGMLMADFLEKNVLIISHGGTSKVMIGFLMGKDLKESIFDLHFDNCSLSVFDIDSSGNCNPILVNETDFLED
ncbi:hypothetical protein GF371_05155, partial [Candidatus Woesearchaeota archaeon]|nr:hypothetical protein [Candidatus Woesearchaeota archaeon]